MTHCCPFPSFLSYSFLLLLLCDPRLFLFPLFLQVGMTVHCRIMKIDIEKFSVDLTCRTSDLMDKANEWKLPKDSYYDFDTETEDQKQEEELKKKQQRTRECKNGITEIIRIAWCTAILTGNTHNLPPRHCPYNICLFFAFPFFSPAYIKRVIAHPNFHNISFNQAEKMMETLDQGDLIIRPSSKGENHLTVTWKVRNG